MRSCFWQRDLVPRGHTRRCADTGRLPPGSRTSRFCRIRLLARAAMAPREETPPNWQGPGARWAPQEKPAHQSILSTLGSQLTASPTGPEDKPQAPPTPSRQLPPLGPVLARLTPAPCVSVDPTLDFCPLLKTTLFFTVPVLTSLRPKTRPSKFARCVSNSPRHLSTLFWGPALLPNPLL